MQRSKAGTAPIMDIAQTRQRSASHSSLRHSYKAHGRHSTGPLTARPSSRQRPLRSVNENATLLRSPGPLESMLKTTTETGDIGLFSIKAGSSSSTYRQPHAPRPPPPDASPVSWQHGRFHGNKHVNDDQFPHRSYRDTTSEIISLYGSDNQQYWLRSASPVFDDGHRSYSLTTCSSRQIPSQKSSGTLQSRSSSGGGGGGGSLQRPRSPFPYPTRMKRLGVRPASPALAENGDIDYSKMVELDRVSQRTVHGSYKPTFAHSARRPPPLSLRPDAKKSATSLSSRAPPVSCHFGPTSGPGPARTPSSSLSGKSRPYERNQGSSADPSVRSASLTSIVDMYQRPLTASSAVPAPRPGGSFYYDYSEEFEKLAPLPLKTEPQAPICPIPQRAGGNSRPMVLRDDTQVDLDAVSPGQDTVGAVSSQDEQRDLPVPIGGVAPEESRRQSVEQSGRNIDDALVSESSSDENAAGGNLNASGSPAPPAGHGGSQPSSLSEPRLARLQGYATPSQPNDSRLLEKTSSSQDVPRLSQSVKSVPVPQEPVQDERPSPFSVVKLRCTLDPTLSEFASLFSSFDRLAKPRGGDNVTDSDEHSPLPQEDDEEVEDYGFPRRLGPRPSLHLFNVVAAESNARERRHRRNVAALRISTAGFDGSEKGRRELSPPEEEVTILSLEPISPVRQLRVKNIIPRLMKALPPLPVEAMSASGQEGMYPLGVAEPPKPYAPKGLSLTEEVHHDGSKLPGTASSRSPAHAAETLEASPSNFQISDRASPSLSRHCGAGSHSQGSEKGQRARTRERANVGAGPRLRIKLSRSRLDRTRPGLNGKALRTNRLKQCNSLADLALGSQRDMGTDQNRASDGVQQRPRSAASELAWASREESVEEAEPSPKLSDQFNISYPPSPKNTERPLRPSTSTSKMTLKSLAADAHSGVEHRGLRQKLSMLRLRITGGLAAEAGKETERAPALDLKCLVANHESEGEASGHSKGRAISTRSEKMGGRVRRWASDAKQAVRSYVRRTLDRSSRLGD